MSAARFVAIMVGLAGFLATSTAPAQQPSGPAQPPVMTGRPTATWIGIGRPGDNAGAVGAFDRLGELQLEPLRLTLLGNHPPHPYDTPGCSDQLADVRTGASGLPAMRSLAMNLFGAPTSWKAPRLTLFGFSRVGCALDGAVAGGLTFVVPIRQDIFFVASGGAILLPHGGPNGSAASSAAARADVVFAKPNGRSFAVGVGTSRGQPQFSFSGTF